MFTTVDTAETSQAGFITAMVVLAVVVFAGMLTIVFLFTTQKACFHSSNKANSTDAKSTDLRDEQTKKKPKTKVYREIVV